MYTFALFAALSACSPTVETPADRVRAETVEPADSDPLDIPDFDDDDDVQKPADPVDPETSDDEDDLPADEDPVDSGLTDFEQCFSDIMGTAGDGPDYDQFVPEVADHCYGTDHQDIQDIERVVFLGDSVTVGSLPTPDNKLYRNVLAGELAQKFNLQSPNFLWKSVNPIDGTTWVQDSGDFSSCAKWGARTDDLQRDGDQLEACFPQSERHKRTLVIMTVGGNDLANLTEGFIEGKTDAELWAQTYETMDLVRDAVAWLKDPVRFPNGVDVIFTNLYEYTDGTGETQSCPAAALAGFNGNVSNPALEQMVLWSMEEFMSIATQYDADMLFLLETFCGHGYKRNDPNGRCYRGPNAEMWFDLTCIHPNPRGHEVIADMFMAVVEE